MVDCATGVAGWRRACFVDNEICDVVRGAVSKIKCHAASGVSEAVLFCLAPRPKREGS